MNTFLRLFTTQPQLLLNHAASYAALTREQGGLSLAVLWHRAFWLALAYASFAVGTALAGVALMLWCTDPATRFGTAWMLLLVPAVPLLMGLWAAAKFKRMGPLPLWAALRQQLDNDLALFKANTP